MPRYDFPTIPEYLKFTASDGIQYKESDIVTCYYAGFYKIIGFYDCEVMGRMIPQVIATQVFDANGKPKSGLKSCIAESMKPALPEIDKDIERIKSESKQKIESLTKLKLILTRNDQ